MKISYYYDEKSRSKVTNLKGRMVNIWLKIDN